MYKMSNLNATERSIKFKWKQDQIISQNLTMRNLSKMQKMLTNFYFKNFFIVKNYTRISIMSQKY